MHRRQPEVEAEELRSEEQVLELRGDLTSEYPAEPVVVGTDGSRVPADRPPT